MTSKIEKFKESRNSRNKKQRIEIGKEIGQHVAESERQARARENSSGSPYEEEIDENSNFR